MLRCIKKTGFAINKICYLLYTKKAYAFIACSSLSVQRNNSSEAVEELKYRRSLKIALDILNQNGSARQVPPSEGPNSRLSQENNMGSPPSTPVRRCRSLVYAREKQEPEASKKKKQQRNNPSLKTDRKTQNQKGSSVLEEGTNLPKYNAGDLCDTSNSEMPNCRTPDSKSLPRPKKNEPRLSTKPKAGSRVSPKPKEEKSKQGRKSWRGAGSPVVSGEDFPEDQAQPLAGEGSPLSVPCVSDVVEPARTSARIRTMLDSSCKSASGSLEKSISCESDNLAKQLNVRKKPVGLKQMNGEQEISATAASCRKRKSRNFPESSSGPSNHRTLPDGFPSQEENNNTADVVVNKVKQFQLPDFEEDEGGHGAWGGENWFGCRAA